MCFQTSTRSWDRGDGKVVKPVFTSLSLEKDRRARGREGTSQTKRKQDESQGGREQRKQSHQVARSEGP